MKFIRLLIVLTSALSGLTLASQTLPKPGPNHVLELDGNGSYMELPPRILDDLKESTIEVWTRWFDLHHVTDIFDLGRDGTEMLLATRGYGALEFKFNVSSEERMARHAVRVFNILRTNEWCHLAAVSGPHGMRLYFNGTLVGTNSYSGSAAALAPGGRNYIGRDNAKGWGKFRTFHGQMDELRIWRVARTEQEIRENMTRSLTGQENGLFGLWNFDGGSLRDATTNGHNGELSGNARVIIETLPKERPKAPHYILRGRVYDEAGRIHMPLGEAIQSRLYHNGVLLDGDSWVGNDADFAIVVDDWPEPFDLAFVKSRSSGWRLNISKDEISAGPININISDQSLSGRVATINNRSCESLLVQAVRVEESKPIWSQGLQGLYYSINEVHSLPDSLVVGSGFPVLKPGCQPVLKRVDRIVKLPKNESAIGEAILADNSYVRWNGIIRIDKKSRYTFFVEADNAAQLRIDHHRLLDLTGIQVQGETSGSIDLDVGDHSLDLEYFHAQGPSRCMLLWSREDQAKEIIPAEYLFSKESTVVANLATNSTTTDIHGGYSFFDLIPGKYRLRAQVGNDYLPLGEEIVEVEPGHPVLGLEHRIAFSKKGSWTQYAMESGLPSDEALSVLGTPDGMIWVGTTVGVARFDGHRFAILTTEQGLLGDITYCIFRDRDGFMWFGTSKGLSRLDLRAKKNNIQRFPVDIADPNEGIKSIIQTKNGRIWVAGSRGLAWFDGETFQRCTVPNGPSKPSGMSADADGTIWITSGNCGLWRFDGKQFSEVDLGRTITSDGCHSPNIDQQGAIWFSMVDQGVGRFLPSKGGGECIFLTRDQGFPGPNCQTLHAAVDGSVWFAYGKNGMIHYAKNHRVCYTDRDGFTADRVNDISTVGDGTVWFATNKGVYRFIPRSSFTHYGRSDGIPSLSTRASLAARDGTVWFGQSAGDDPDVLYRSINENGLVRFNSNGFHDATNIPVSRIKYGPDGVIWFATPNPIGDKGGVRRFGSGQWTTLRKGMPTGLVLDLDFDSNGSVWFAHGAEGVSRFEPKAASLGERAFKVFSLKATHLTAPISRVLCAKDGSIWFGSSGGGVSRFHAGTFVHYGINEGFVADQVRDMLQTPDGFVWFATEVGAIRYDGSHFQVFDRSKDRLISSDVLSIFRDSHGTLWFGTRAGVSRFDGNSWSSLDNLDWGAGKEVRTICEDREHHYWFGTDQGIVRYIPEDNKPNAPIITLQTDRKYDDTSSIPPVLTGTQITFLFNTIDTIHRVESRRYRYQILRVENDVKESMLNKQWIYPGKESQAQWLANEIGAFTLVAQYIDRDLNCSEPTMVTLHVVAPWYANLWITVPSLTVSVFLLTMGSLAGVQYSKKRRETELLREQIQKQDLQTRHALEAKAIALAESNRQLGLAREAAEAARANADSANQAKSQFLANMSHELRTPLNAIIGYSEMLQEEAEDLGVPDINPDLQKINGAGKHLLGLINDILDLSKIEAGKMTLYLESFDVCSVLNEVAAMVQPLVRKNGNQLTLEVASDVGVMRADVTKVRQTLFNLLSNASKFTENGKIILRARRLEGDVVFDVIDSGIGMTSEQVGRLFQAFAQADASTSKKYGGTGLGLALSRKFCQIMGGDMTVASEFGKGSTFTATIPAVVRELVDSTKPESAAVIESTGSVGSGPLVLVIDDDGTVQDLLRRSLNRDGFRVEVASNGVTGLARARELRPNIITLDVMMPGMDGWDVLGSLKEDPLTADIPVIVVSIVDEKGLGFSLGAADYLTKPLDYSRLSLVVNRHTKARLGQRVLVVEDDEATQVLVQKHLSKAGWQVITANGGRSALERVSEGKPDLVLLDLMMPEMDGFEFLGAFRKQPGCAQITVVVMTAKVLTDQDRQRLRGQVAHIVEKRSMTPESLALDIRKHLAVGREVLSERQMKTVDRPEC